MEERNKEHLKENGEGIRNRAGGMKKRADEES